MGVVVLQGFSFEKYPFFQEIIYEHFLSISNENFRRSTYENTYFQLPYKPARVVGTMKNRASHDCMKETVLCSNPGRERPLVAKACLRCCKSAPRWSQLRSA